jgi:hypothetical protein
MKEKAITNTSIMKQPCLHVVTKTDRNATDELHTILKK